MKNKVMPEPILFTEQILKIIGLKIRTHRKSIDKNYEDFAKDHKINKVTLNRIENGENFMMSSLIQVLHSMNITLEDFFKDIR